MTITVRLFATLREAAGVDVCRFTFPSGAVGRDVHTALQGRYPGLQRLLASARMARNLDYQAWEAPLRDGDEVCVIPPVSGG